MSEPGEVRMLLVSEKQRDAMMAYLSGRGPGMAISDLVAAWDAGGVSLVSFLKALEIARAAAGGEAAPAGERMVPEFACPPIVAERLRLDGWVGANNTWQRPEWEGRSVGWGAALLEPEAGGERPIRSNAHPEDYCQECGGPNVVWFTPSEIWNKAVDDERTLILCPACFVRRAEARGIKPTAWQIEPERFAGVGSSVGLRETIDNLMGAAYDGCSTSSPDGLTVTLHFRKSPDGSLVDDSFVEREAAERKT